MSERFLTLPEIHRAAKRLLPPGAYGYGAGGAETETTLRRNRHALQQLAIRQRVLVDVRNVDLSTTFLGMELPLPIAIAPMGGLVVFHPHGDVEMARGAASSGNLAVVSGVTGWPVEEVAQAAQGPLIFQLYFGGPRSWVQELLGRVEASGYCAVCLTVDLQKYGRRERDLHLRYDPRDARKGTPNPPPPEMDYQARLTWDDVAWLQSILSIPLGIKGILTAEDARRAVEAGVKIIWVSNHGGRQLDSTQATIDVLPEIVEAVAGRAEIMIDGGFRRGTDVIKGLALGAKVIAMGRTMLWGLTVGGAAGVERTLQILREELETSLGLCGQTSVRGLTPELIRQADFPRLEREGNR
ncbi:MAG: alpha-hydroxy-acid oxidizing protein [Deltaproteobacteria bacterium]|nr:alpha-hydroxy-acid oxidizing protein [Deltaproteobacteria bacterium]